MRTIRPDRFSILVTFGLQVSTEATFIVGVILETLNYQLYCSAGSYLKAKDLKFSLSS